MNKNKLSVGFRIVLKSINFQYLYIYLSNYIKTIIYTAVSHMKCKISCAPQ